MLTAPAAVASPVLEPPATERARGFILHCSHLPQTPQAGSEAGPHSCPPAESPGLPSRSQASGSCSGCGRWADPSWWAWQSPPRASSVRPASRRLSVSRVSGPARGYQGRQRPGRQGGAGGEGTGAGGGEGEGGPQKSPALPPSGVAPAALRLRCSNRRALTAGSRTRQAGSTRVSRSRQAR